MVVRKASRGKVSSKTSAASKKRTAADKRSGASKTSSATRTRKPAAAESTKPSGTETKAAPATQATKAASPKKEAAPSGTSSKEEAPAKTETPTKAASNKTSVAGKSRKSSKCSTTTKIRRRREQPTEPKPDPVPVETEPTNKSSKFLSVVDGQEKLDFAYLTETDFYHGHLTRVDAEMLVLYDGDFLVRATQKEDGTKAYTITIRGGEDHSIHHLVPKTTQDNHVRIGGQEFDDFGHLIKYYFNEKKQLLDMDLLRPVVRPDWQLEKSSVELTDRLGEGAFGEVHKGWLYLPTGRFGVAVKLCHNDTLTKAQLNEFMTEARLMRQYADPNVVRFYGVVVESEPVMIVMELMPGGSLIDLLKKEGESISFKSRLYYCRDISAGLRYLHSKHCVHRDIAARNCLLDSEGVVKLSDFGLCRQLEDGPEQTQEYKMTKKYKMPIRWMAPEAITTNISTYNSDVWSFGVVVWEIYSNGAVPYEDLKKTSEVREQVTEHGLRLTHPAIMPKDVCKIVDDCWALEPDQRPSFKIIHRLIEKYIRQRANAPDDK